MSTNRSILKFLYNKLNNLQTIPCVGEKIAQEFLNIGIKKISDLKGKDPNRLYEKICGKNGYPVDRRVLYICRSSVYFSKNKNPDPEKLKWWNWKD